MSTPLKLKTVLDLERMTRAEITALYMHCMRMIGDDDHIIKDQTKDNKWLIGNERNFLHVLDAYIEKVGATIDKRNVSPATALVLQASPEYFRPEYHRDDPKGFGKYDQKKLDDWVEANVKWLKKTFGNDCVVAHLHVDERIQSINVREAKLEAKEKELDEREKALELFEDLDCVELEDGSMKPEDEARLVEKGIIDYSANQKTDPDFRPQIVRVRGQRVR